VTNHVIRPRNRDDEHKRIKTGRTDPQRASGAAVLF